MENEKIKDQEAHSSCSCHSHEHTHEEDESKVFELIRLAVSILFFIAGIFTLKQADKQILFFLSLPSLLFVFTWFISGFEVLSASVKNILHGEFFDENFLMTIASIGAFILGEYFEGAAVMLLFNIGELVQDYAVNTSRKSISNLISLQVDEAHVIENGKEKNIPAEKVSVNSLILVKPGEKIPIDGIVESGSALVDTASLSGESLPRSVGVGDSLLAGFISLDGALQIRTTALFSETAASKLSTLIKNAENQKTASEKFITRFSRVYTPIVTLSAICLAIIPPVVLSIVHKKPISGFENFSTWFYRALIFLTVSCPCALVISVPLTYFASLGGLAKKGILVKGANFIDNLASIKTAVFDKTGTLSEGRLSVSSIECKNDFTEDRLLQLAYSAEKNSTHPIAKAIIEAAKSRCSDSLLNENFSSQNFLELPGKGVQLEINGKLLLLGNEKIFEYAKIDFTKEDVKNNKTSVYVIYDHKVAGRIYFNDTLRKSSFNLVKNLSAVGVKNTVILTGDNFEQAAETARILGVSDFKAELLPEEKLNELKKIISQTKKQNSNASVSFLGDGINDAAAITLADVGISFGNISSELAIESADVILLNEDLNLLARAILHAKKTSKIVRQNIIFAVGVKVLFLILGAFGLIGMILAIFADVGVCLIAVLNSLRAR